MVELKELLQKGDWKNEKHMPVIEVVKHDGSLVEVEAVVGKEIQHPNKTEHHIEFIKLMFLPDGEKFPYIIGEYHFCAHGASVKGPDTSTIYCEPHVIARFKTEKPGFIIGESYCNIHGLWTSEIRLN
ncbi:MAG: desulfoferrodoxin family protein [Candidatus Thermoplasmatota archaeon]|nr:desulfoferrodoxin family protein [Candidatus Thermoplasmatota archaeon]